MPAFPFGIPLYVCFVWSVCRRLAGRGGAAAPLQARSVGEATTYLFDVDPSSIGLARSRLRRVSPVHVQRIPSALCPFFASLFGWLVLCAFFLAWLCLIARSTSTISTPRTCYRKAAKHTPQTHHNTPQRNREHDAQHTCERPEAFVMNVSFTFRD